MRAYIIRRVLLLIPTFFLLTLLVFLSVRFLPGNLLDTMAGEGFGVQKPTDRKAIERMLGLDVPVHAQYGRWLGGLLLRGTLGRSMIEQIPVEEKLLAHLPVTLELGILAILIGLLIALPVGIYSALRQDTIGDYAGRSFAIIGLATPDFWLATMLIIYPAVWWAWMPPLELVPFSEDPLGHLEMFLLPCLILGTGLAAITMRLTRTMMLEVLRQDYIRTAWAKGLKEKVIVLRHATKNALIPVLTLIGLQLPILVGGSVILENLFALPGLGRVLLLALQERDYPIVSGANLLFAGMVMTGNLLIDLIYPFLDPRVRYK